MRMIRSFDYNGAIRALASTPAPTLGQKRQLLFRRYNLVRIHRNQREILKFARDQL